MCSDNGELILATVAALAALAVVVVLVVRFFRQIVSVVLALAALVVVGMGAYALVSQGRANERMAAAAAAASAGQTAGNIAVVVLSLLLAGTVILSLAALAAAAYFRFRLRASRELTTTGRWQPGPNALWGRAQPRRPVREVKKGGTELLLPLLAQQMTMMMQAMMMGWMQERQLPTVEQPHSPSSFLLGTGDGDTLPPEWVEEK